MMLVIDQVKTFGMLEEGERDSDVDARVNAWQVENPEVDIVDIKPSQGLGPWSYKVMVHFRVVLELEVESV